jgi:hypothetical protein
MDYSKPSKKEILEWSLLALLLVAAIAVACKVVVVV